jgi:[ribosomal protein S5]-alanine N-acetyltransferase
MIKKIESQLTYELRKKVLRPDLSYEELNYEGDLHKDSIHLGYFDRKKIIGIVTLYHTATQKIQNESPETMYRLRGMAVDFDTQKNGIGSSLLQACKDQITSVGGALLWCDARTEAKDFYEKNGFTTVGNQYIVPNVGPHYIMYWKK